MPKNITELNS